MQRVRPPFRADHVGSLLRPPALKRARSRHGRGEIGAQELRREEDVAIAAVIRRQEEIGLEGITDGELRRSHWYRDFLGGLAGVEAAAPPQDGAPAGAAAPLRVTGRIAFASHPMIEDFRDLHARTRRTAKVAIPSPGLLVSVARDWRPLVSRDLYGDLDALFADLAQAYRAAIRAFHAAGCRYLQIDDTNFAMACDAKFRAAMAARGDDPDRWIARLVDLINACLEDKPGDLIVTVHTCRGNLRSGWMAEGGYAPVAEAFLGRLAVDGFFVEYDSARAGGFEPLARVADDKAIVLGLVSTKSGALESAEWIRQRIRAASRHVGLDRLCLSPQCGFASTQEGNLLTEDEQWAKLALVTSVAGDVWG